MFFGAYALLSLVRHDHYQSFGFDLGIADQIVWRYSTFQAPITTIAYYPFTSKLTDHLDLLYPVISPFYWIWSSPKMLLIFQSLFVCVSGFAVFLLARRKKISYPASIALLVGYLSFYGVQNALWFDAHGVSFGASFLMWFIYFLETRHRWGSVITFLLAIASIENIAVITLFIAFYYFIKRKERFSLVFVLLSLVYLFGVFRIYFPYFTGEGFRYTDTRIPFIRELNPMHFFDSDAKRQVIFYSLAWFGFLPLLAPLALLPAVADLGTYYLFAQNLPRTHGLFMHYRITLAPLLVWATIESLRRLSKRTLKRAVPFYLIACVVVFQYLLHLPLSYLTKSWFWQKPQSVDSINAVIATLPSTASVVSQNNITPHISQRDQIFTLWPEKRDFEHDSPCGAKTCDWFRWAGSPQYLIVDTGDEWDIRHFLANREEFIKGIQNLETAGVIRLIERRDTAVLYEIIKNPQL